MEKWTVKHDECIVPFATFQKALSYADRIACKQRGIKRIDLEKGTIEIEQPGIVTWADGQSDEELSAASRHRRAGQQ